MLTSQEKASLCGLSTNDSFHSGSCELSIDLARECDQQVRPHGYVVALLSLTIAIRQCLTPAKIYLGQQK